MYEFTQDCLTGIDQIDEEHRKLFSLINEAVELPKEARTSQTVKNSHSPGRMHRRCSMRF